MVPHVRVSESACRKVPVAVPPFVNADAKRLDLGTQLLLLVAAAGLMEHATNPPALATISAYPPCQSPGVLTSTKLAPPSTLANWSTASIAPTIVVANMQT